MSESAMVLCVKKERQLNAKLVDGGGGVGGRSVGRERDRPSVDTRLDSFDGFSMQMRSRSFSARWGKSAFLWLALLYFYLSYLYRFIYYFFLFFFLSSLYWMDQNRIGYDEELLDDDAGALDLHRLRWDIEIDDGVYILCPRDV